MEQFYENKRKNIAIVGGGPSGIYCAINILEKLKENNFLDYQLTIFDKGQILRTILPTGGTRCNITNAIDDIDEFIQNYPRGKKFLYSLFSKHFTYDTLSNFEKYGIKTYIQEDKRIFPVSNSAKDVKDKLLNQLKKFDNVKLVNKKINSKDDLKDFGCVIIAAGSRESENLILSFNHKLIPFKKVLTGLKIKNNIYPKGVSVKSTDGDFIFTPNGISGPLAFKISSINADKPLPYEIKIKLFNTDDILREIKNNPKKTIGNVISKFIPKSLAVVIIQDFNKKASEVSKKDIEKYSYLNLTVVNTEQTGEIVNKGGVDLDELNQNCRSKLNDNLWYIGEILNIDGFCGGFNLQNCWSSAYVVANDVVKAIMK